MVKAPEHVNIQDYATEFIVLCFFLSGTKQTFLSVYFLNLYQAGMFGSHALINVLSRKTFFTSCMFCLCCVYGKRMFNTRLSHTLHQKIKKAFHL